MNYYSCVEVSEYLIYMIETIYESLYEPEKKMLHRVEEYIAKNYAEELTLETMATYFGYEYGYFSKIFRRLKGVTFKKYLNTIRMEKAKELIETSNMKYSEIAMNVGYHNYEHFSRVFREH